MSSVGGAAWKTEEEIAARMQTAEIPKEDHQEAVRQEDRELQQTGHVCDAGERDNV